MDAYALAECRLLLHEHGHDDWSLKNDPVGRNYIRVEDPQQRLALYLEEYPQGRRRGWRAYVPAKAGVNRDGYGYRALTPQRANSKSASSPQQALAAALTWLAQNYDQRRPQPPQP